MANSNHEIFRFVSMRGVQRATDQDVGDKLIETHGALSAKSPFYEQLRVARETGRRYDMIKAATDYARTAEFVARIELLTLPVAALERWLFDHGDKVQPSLLTSKVRAFTDREPAQLVHDQSYRTDRLRIADSLLALSVAPQGWQSVRNGLLRAIYVFELLERLGAKPSRLKSAQDVHRLLVNGIVLLPQEVFPLPERDQSREGMVADSGKPRETADGVLSVLTAIDELRREFRQQLTVGPADDPPLPKAMAVVRATPDLQREGLPLTSVDLPLTAEVRRWAIPEKALERLSPGTLKTLRQLGAPETMLRNVPDTVSLLELEAGRVGAQTPPNGASSTMLLLGNNYVDANSILKPDEVVRPNPIPTSPPTSASIWQPATNLARLPAIADLRVVRQDLVRYEKGEVAHIENVLRRETKERVHKRSTTAEETVTLENERQEESERDVQSAQRFEMQRESSQIIHDDTSLETGLTISASYGPTVSATANLGFAMNNSRDEATRAATSFARDVSERTAARIKVRTREQRVTRTVETTEETNRHGIDNKDGTGHVVGVYRWVDKIYKAQVFNYGRRMLLEFNVPEPAAFYLFCTAAKSPEGITLTRPEPPTDPISGQPLSPTHINHGTYLSLVQKYSVGNVSPPPSAYQTVGAAWEEKPSDDKREEIYYAAKKEIAVPSGYKATSFRAALLGFTSSGQRDAFLAVGSEAGRQPGSFVSATIAGPLYGEEGTLPAALYVISSIGYAISVEVLCERTSESWTKWQLETFEAVMRAYFELKAEYDEQVAAAATRQGIGIRGRNPLQNRQIERAELKKSAISLMKGPHFESFLTIRPAGVPPYPEIEFEEARNESEHIQFFEQAFEWPQMTYLYYPYFWGRRPGWLTSSQLDDPDPLFAAFLRAGAARVIVPVRPGFEQAISHYLGTGVIWNGAQVPQVGDPLYVSIIQEMQEQQGAAPDGVAEGSPWEVRLPTTLVILQEDAELPAF